MSIQHTIRTSTPGKRVHPMVRFYWEMDLRDHSREIGQDLIPSAFIDLIFPVESGLKVRGSSSAFDKPFLSPILTEGKRLTFLKGCLLFGIRLDAVPGARLIDCSPSELKQGPNELLSVLRRPVREDLYSLIFNTDRFEDRVAVLDIYFSRFELPRGENTVETCLAAFEFIRRNPQAKVSDVCERSGYSARWIEMVFRENLGCTPKTVIRIVRLNRFLESLTCRQNATLTDLALDAGFYDQSHLIREFRKFGGFSPSEFGRRHPHFNKVMNHT